MGRVQTARFDNLIRRLFSIKGGGSLLAETLADAFPVIQLEGGPIELLKLSGWTLGMVGNLGTSPVGQTIGWQLFNPVGSGKIAVPTTAFWNVGAQNTVFLGVTDVALGTAAVGRQRDTREGVLAQTVCQFRHGFDPVPPVNAIRFRPVANQDIETSDSDGLAVLAPGTGLTFVTVQTNSTFRAGFLFRERIAEPSELSFP